VTDTAALSITQIVQSILAILLTTLQTFSLSTPQITAIINFLIGIAPTVEKEYEDLKQPLQLVLEALEGQASATPEQLAVVRSMKSSADADYDAAYAAYIAAHGAV